jgi:multiple sugar transport system substrate-binding protein
MRQRGYGGHPLWMAVWALVVCGCPTAPPPQETDASTALPLRLIVVDDPELGAAIQQQWNARAEGALELRPMSSQELIDPRRKRLAADAVIYPSGLIGELAEREWIAPLPDEALDLPDFARRDIFDHLRQREIVWGDQVFAVPLGSPPLLLIYRPDVFEKLELQPPETWQQYTALCERLSKAGNPLADSQDAAWRSAAEPWGPGWASQVLLARAACYARHRSYFATLFELPSLEPQIATPPFVTALEELVAAAKYGGPDAEQLEPKDVWRLLRSGQCAMGLAWPTTAQSSSEPAPVEPSSPVLLAAARLPASRQAYHVGDGQWQQREETESGQVTLLSVSGRLGSVVKGSARSQAAISLLVRLSGAEWSRDVSPRSLATTLYRSSQMPNAQAWTGESFSAEAATAYADLVQQSLRQTLTVDSVRLPGRARYLAALDQAVYAALRGERPPAECLQEAAQQWRKITAELGIEEQRRAYWRSLGKRRP